MMKDIRPADEALAASGVYALLSRIWLREIDVSFIEQLRDTPLGEAFRSAGGIVPPTEDIDELAAEYCRLFIGPKNHLPPFQSVWAQGTLQSEITNSVQTFADALRYQHDANDGSAMSDHLGMQLGIMSHALRLLGEAPTDEARMELVDEFYRRHLTWPYKLFASAKERCELEFYTSMIEMTESFLLSFAPRT